MAKEENFLESLPALSPLVRNKPKKIKNYNFKNPDKFSKDHLKVLGSIHETFCRQANMALNAALRMSTELSVANVQQLTYGDFITSMPDDLLIGILNMYPFTTQFCIGVEKHLVGAMIDRLLGGAGTSNIKDELTDVEVGIVKDTLRRMLNYLPEGWQMLIPATDDVELVALEQNPISAQIIPPTDIVALVTINAEIGSYLGFMNICIPYSALEDVIPRLNRQSTYKHDKLHDQDAKELILKRLCSTELLVKIILANGQLNLNEIMNLQNGDIIKLDTRPEDLAEIWVGEELKFRGRPGQSRKKYSVSIKEAHIED